MRSIRLAFASSALVLAGCGTQTPPASDVSFVAWSLSSVQSSLIADATKDEIHVCLEGRVTDADLERSIAWSHRAILTWFRIFKTVDERVTSNIVYTCASRDLTIRLRSGSGTSFASPSVATIYMTRPYGTWTHELGHALAGLGDTYAGGAGQCQRGQPQSLMCWGAYGPRANPDEFSTLWEDDIAGALHNYRRLFGEDTVAPEWAGEIDLEAPLDPEAPWPSDLASPKIVDHQVTVISGGLTAVNPDLGIDL